MKKKKATATRKLTAIEVKKMRTLQANYSNFLVKFINSDKISLSQRTTLKKAYDYHVKSVLASS